MLSSSLNCRVGGNKTEGLAGRRECCVCFESPGCCEHFQRFSHAHFFLQRDLALPCRLSHPLASTPAEFQGLVSGTVLAGGFGTIMLGGSLGSLVLSHSSEPRL